MNVYRSQNIKNNNLELYGTCEEDQVSRNQSKNGGLQKWYNVKTRPFRNQKFDWHPKDTVMNFVFPKPSTFLQATSFQASLMHDQTKSYKWKSNPSCKVKNSTFSFIFLPKINISTQFFRFKLSIDLLDISSFVLTKMTR